MNNLSNKQVRHLRKLAHSLKPVVIIGDKGLTQAVIEEIDNTLNIHELIKVKVRAEEREERQAIVEQMIQKTASSKVQQVGHIVTIFKRNKEARIALPK